MDINNIITKVTNEINNKTAPNTIPPATVGNSIIDLAKLTKETIEGIDITTKEGIETNKAKIDNESKKDFINLLPDPQFKTFQETGGVDIFTIDRQTGTGGTFEITKIKDNVFGYIVQMKVPANSRYRMYSKESMSLPVNEAGSIYSIGMFVKGASGINPEVRMYNGSLTPLRTNATTPLTLSNGWSFVFKQNSSALIDLTAKHDIVVDNTTGAEITVQFAFPILVNTDKIFPKLYFSNDKAGDIVYNLLSNFDSRVTTHIYNTNFYTALKAGNVFSNADYSDGTKGHEFLNAGTFTPEYTLVDKVTPIGNKAIEVSNVKRSSDEKVSTLRDRLSITIPADQIGKRISFSYLYAGDPSVAYTSNVEGYTEENTYMGILAGSQTSTDTLETFDGLVWYRHNRINILIPEGIHKLVFSVRLTASSTQSSNQVFKSYHTGMMGDFVDVKVQYRKSAITQLVEDPIFNQLQPEDVLAITAGALKGKRWTSYGDSITEGNQWQPAVASKFGLLHSRRGIGGTNVQETGSKAWVNADGLYVGRPIGSGGTSNTQPPNTTEILSSMCNLQRIATIPLDTELITIMGGTNDYGKPLGAITDTGDNTFYGGYQNMLNRIYDRIPNAEVILITPVHRKNEAIVHPNGMFFEQYREAIRTIAKKYKYRVIEMSECGINELNTGTFTPDGIHPNSLGGQRMARIVIKEFNQIFS